MKAAFRLLGWVVCLGVMPALADITYTGGDGSSQAKAIVIQGTNGRRRGDALGIRLDRKTFLGTARVATVAAQTATRNTTTSLSSRRPTA